VLARLIGNLRRRWLDGVDLAALETDASEPAKVLANMQASIRVLAN